MAELHVARPRAEEICSDPDVLSVLIGVTSQRHPLAAHSRLLYISIPADASQFFAIFVLILFISPQLFGFVFLKILQARDC